MKNPEEKRFGTNKQNVQEIFVSLFSHACIGRHAIINRTEEVFGTNGICIHAIYKLAQTDEAFSGRSHSFRLYLSDE